MSRLPQFYSGCSGVPPRSVGQNRHRNKRGDASFMLAPAFQYLPASRVRGHRFRSSFPARAHSPFVESDPSEVVVGLRASEPRISSQPQLEREVVHEVNGLRPLMEGSCCALAVYGGTTPKFVRCRARTVVLPAGISRDMKALAEREAQSVAATASDVGEAVGRLCSQRASPEGARALARRASVRFMHRR